MLNLNEVLEFIINSNPDEFNQIKNKVEIKKNQLAQRTKESIRLGDIVGIKHAQIDPKKNFRVIKISMKNIKVQTTDVGEGRVGGFFRVSPSLLIFR